jgi:hypothetical protein
MNRQRTTRSAEETKGEEKPPGAGGFSPKGHTKGLECGDYRLTMAAVVERELTSANSARGRGLGALLHRVVESNQTRTPLADAGRKSGSLDPLQQDFGISVVCDIRGRRRLTTSDGTFLQQWS